MKKVEAYASEVPEELRYAIRGLDSDYRTAIFVALYKHGELSFSELQKILEMDKAMLNYHLGILVESALVHHYYEHELGSEKYSFYNVTSYGQSFLETLVQSLKPQPQHVYLLEGDSAAAALVRTLIPADSATSDANVFCALPTPRQREPRTPPSTI